MGGATLKIIEQDLLETALEFFYPLTATINLKKNMGLLKIVLSMYCNVLFSFVVFVTTTYRVHSG